MWRSWPPTVSRCASAVPEDVRTAKAELRRRYLELRRGMDPAARAALSARIAGRLSRLPVWRDARVVHLYIGAIGGEVETRALALDALGAGKRVACPRVPADGVALEHYEIRSLADLTEGPQGLWEPDPSHGSRIGPAELDLVLVPGIAFDREGNRLGFGAGYYDRFLREVGAPKVVLAFSLQITAAIPHGPGDVPVEWIVTESETIACRANRETPGRGSRPAEAGK